MVNSGTGVMCPSFLPSNLLALILSETVEHGRSPERPPDNAYDRTSNPMVYIMGYEQNTRYERCENERKSNLALYQLSLPSSRELRAQMHLDSMVIGPAIAAPEYGGLLLVPFDQGANRGLPDIYASDLDLL